MTLIEAIDLRKDYTLGKTTIQALGGITFSVEEGEFLSVVGPSGCGKTTLLNILGCIDVPSSGTVRFQGRDVSSLTDDEESAMRLSTIGFIFQSFNLIPVLNIRENIEFPMLLRGRSKAERRARVDRLVSLVGLEPWIDHKPDELSGGQRQRVAIARALVNEPRLVIADEPTANLDTKTGDTVLDIMKRLNEEEKVTFIFSTHDPRVMAHAHRVIRLRDGLLDSETELRG